MARYLLAVHTPVDQPRQPMTAEQIQQGYALVAGLEQEMNSAGALLFSARLEDPSASTVVNASNGKVVTTDGPFTESKEAIGGFYIIEAEDLDGALAWASKTSAAIHMPIEVRPFWSEPEG